MFLRTFDANGTPQRLEFQTNTQSILVNATFRISKVTLATDVGEGLATEEEVVLKRILADLTGIVSITRYTKDGQKNIVTNIPMSALMEISAFGRSVVYHQRVITDAARAGGYIEYVTKFFIPLSNFGSVVADKSEFIVMDFTNPSVSGIKTFSIYSIGSYVSLRDYLVIDSLSAQENQTTNFDCEANYLLVLPASANKVRLDSHAGDSLELKGIEIADLQHMTTEAVHDVNGRMFRSVLWNAIDVAQAYRGELLLDAKSNFYLLSNKVI